MSVSPISCSTKEWLWGPCLQGLVGMKVQVVNKAPEGRKAQVGTTEVAACKPLAEWEAGGFRIDREICANTKNAC